jgi:AhpD family alkylhydroperoxidase
MQALEKMIFQKMAPRSVRYLARLDYARVDGLAARVFEQLAAEFQIVPPITLHLPNIRLMAGVWGTGRECLVVGQAGRADREAVAAAVSQINTCPFCVDVHGAMLHGAGNGALAEELLSGEENPEMPARTRNLVHWARATLSPGAEILRNPPFSIAEAPQILGTAVCFHYLNRMVNVFLEKSPLPGPAASFRKTGARVFGSLVGRRIVALDAEPGRFLLASGAMPLPVEFRWAANSPHVAGALQRFAGAAEEAGRESLDAEVRELVSDRVTRWDGVPPGPSRAWAEEAAAPLSKDQQPAARLALLTALASYQVDEKIVNDFRKHRPSDSDLVNTAAWASYTAAKRISGWLFAPAR